MFVTSETSHESIGPYVCITTSNKAPLPCSKSDTTLRSPVPSPLFDSSPFGRASEPIGKFVQEFDLQYNPDVVVHAVVPHVHAASLATMPLVMLHFGTMLHLFTDSRQNKPVDVVQFDVPQVHAASLATVPLVMTHGAAWHLFADSRQNKPVDDVVQSAVPQEQFLELATLPDLSKHVASLPHFFKDHWQNKPLDAVHAFVPHKHSLALAKVPLVILHGCNGAL